MGGVPVELNNNQYSDISLQITDATDRQLFQSFYHIKDNKYVLSKTDTQSLVILLINTGLIVTLVIILYLNNIELPDY